MLKYVNLFQAEYTNSKTTIAQTISPEYRITQQQQQQQQQSLFALLPFSCDIL